MQNTENPLERGPKPPFPAQPQENPGLEAKMSPRPDYGEKTYKGSGKLLGKKAIITGGDSGIGRAVALAYAREGADVLISYLEEEEIDARETAAIVEKEGRRCVTVAGDIQSAEHCRTLIGRMEKELGGVDILVNNAAFQMSRESLDEITPEEFDRTFRTNVYAAFYLTQAAVKKMKPGAPSSIRFRSTPIRRSPCSFLIPPPRRRCRT
jgi:NAD(P)-dependent dehydrogenase (short-subunit alcohol dehydrogenase family)